ncbi:MAG: DUF86 domain-containing protein [Bacteroidales bacterium]|nr:DUF86 domain-containing protein [Bacteroidales bacterium]
MREPERDKGLLQDIVTYAGNVLKIMDNVTDVEDFKTNIMAYYSVMKNIEIIGEAAYKLTKEFRLQHNEIPWEQIIGMRHVLVHGYATVTPKKLYMTATEDIEPLKQQAESLLEKLQ